MNVQLLQQSVTEHFTMIRPKIDRVLLPIITRVNHSASTINIKPFVRALNTALAGTKVRIVTEITTRFGSPESCVGSYPSIGGYCFEPTSDRFRHLARIKIVLCIHPSTNRLALSVAAWEYFRYRLLKTILHELVHRAQFSQGRKYGTNLVFRPDAAASVNPRLVKDQEYLGDIDEVEAYSRDCVEEWHYLRPTEALTLRAIKREFRNKGGDIPALQYYYEIYEGNENHRSVQRLFRKVRAWHEVVTPLALYLPPSPSFSTGR
jgi:hypothetical protein